jgi:hypothetical protein
MPENDPSSLTSAAKAMEVMKLRWTGNFDQYAVSPMLQVSIGKLKYSMVVFSRIQYFLSFSGSNTRTIPAFRY